MASRSPALMGNYNYSLDSTEGVTFDGKLLCIETDNLGIYLFTLVQRNRK
jgi:hypothetical protein